MKPIRTTLQICTILMSLASAHVCFGQFGAQSDRGYNPPTFSPYINLLRNNGGVGQNYYGLVRPQMDFAQQNQQLNQGLQQLQMQNQNPNQMGRVPGGYGYSQLGVTGHPVIFNSFGNGQFTGGYTGMAGGGMGGGGFGGGGFGGGGGMQGGNQFGQMGMGGAGMNGVGMGFSGVTGFAPQFGGIGNTYRAGGR